MEVAVQLIVLVVSVAATAITNLLITHIRIETRLTRIETKLSNGITDTVRDHEKRLRQQELKDVRPLRE